MQQQTETLLFFHHDTTVLSSSQLCWMSFSPAALSIRQFDSTNWFPIGHTDRMHGATTAAILLPPWSVLQLWTERLHLKFCIIRLISLENELRFCCNKQKINYFCISKSILV